MQSLSRAAVIGGSLVFVGFFVGSVVSGGGEQNRRLHPAQVRRAEAEARWFEERAATERRERELRKQEWIEQQAKKEMERKFGWIDDLQQQVEEQEKRLTDQRDIRLQRSSTHGK